MSTQTERFFSRKSSGRGGAGITVNHVYRMSPSLARQSRHAPVLPRGLPAVGHGEVDVERSGGARPLSAPRRGPFLGDILQQLDEGAVLVGRLGEELLGIRDDE